MTILSIYATKVVNSEIFSMWFLQRDEAKETMATIDFLLSMVDPTTMSFSPFYSHCYDKVVRVMPYKVTSKIDKAREDSSAQQHRWINCQPNGKERIKLLRHHFAKEWLCCWDTLLKSSRYCGWDLVGLAKSCRRQHCKRRIFLWDI